MPLITAIVPAYNEEIAIGSVVIRTSEFVDRVIVVDDGSTDNTAYIAEKAGAEVIKHPHNQGKGAALKTGFQVMHETDIFLTIDGDGQHNPQEIPLLIKPIVDGEADLVNGSRYLNKKHHGTPIYEEWAKILDGTAKISLGLKITDRNWIPCLWPHRTCLHVL